MRKITMREFAALCRNDPGLFAQTVNIPKTLTPEKIFALAERNGYQIIAEQAEPVSLDDDALDKLSGGAGGMSRDQQLDALHTWMYYVMGFGETAQPE